MVQATPRWKLRFPTRNLDAPDPILIEYLAEDTEKVLSQLADPVVLIAHTDGAPHSIGNATTTATVGVWGTNYVSPAAAAKGAFISPGGIHPKEKGIYLVSGGLSFEPTDALGRRGAWPAVNGVGAGTHERAIIPASAEGTSVAMITQPLILDVTDVVSIVPYQSSGGTINYTSGSLSLTLIGRL